MALNLTCQPIVRIRPFILRFDQRRLHLALLQEGGANFPSAPDVVTRKNTNHMLPPRAPLPEELYRGAGSVKPSLKYLDLFAGLRQRRPGGDRREWLGRHESNQCKAQEFVATGTISVAGSHAVGIPAIYQSIDVRSPRQIGSGRSTVKTAQMTQWTKLQCSRSDQEALPL
jgi:hypothetical protein